MTRVADILVPNPATGTPVFGRMPLVVNTTDPDLACLGGDIVLPLGDVAQGLLHIRKHEQRILRLHGASVLDHLATVCSQFHEVYRQRRTGTYLLLKYNGIKAAVVAHRVDGVYRIVTSYPVDRRIDHQRRNERLIWRR